jgi:hypothetical protein
VSAVWAVAWLLAHASVCAGLARCHAARLTAALAIIGTCVHACAACAAPQPGPHQPGGPATGPLLQPRRLRRPRRAWCAAGASARLLWSTALMARP